MLVGSGHPGVSHPDVVGLPSPHYVVDVATIRIEASPRVMPDVAVTKDDDLGLFDDRTGPPSTVSGD
ncbi:hypothetical protein [Rathayibacter soli]|uniref:hypothetical protein n=1 Tax=Rathayibacter soli TaxID=3144168 RepID=UPI0027E44CAE|nr:hypothetical protein [Glaciibacter superstes]